MLKMKNVAKIEIVLHDPYSNALWGGGLGDSGNARKKIFFSIDVSPRWPILDFGQK